MRKILLFIVFIILICFSGCSTMNTTVPPGEGVPLKDMDSPELYSVDDISLFTIPDENSFIMMSVSPRFLTREDEQKFALASAAKQISIYYGARISYQRFIDENIIGTIQVQQVDIGYSRNLALSILDKLEIIREAEDHDYYAAVIRLNEVQLPPFPQIDLIPGEKPSWINTPPQFDGFLSGVGITGQRKSVFESWDQADKLAMAEIAESINTNIRSGTANIERGTGSRTESASAIKTYSVSDVYIDGAYIISRWREPDSSYYYSLAISGKP